MPYVPTTQIMPIVTDMHYKPCAWGSDDCDWLSDSTSVDQEVFSGISDFLACRRLTGRSSATFWMPVPHQLDATCDPREIAIATHHRRRARRVVNQPFRNSASPKHYSPNAPC